MYKKKDDKWNGNKNKVKWMNEWRKEKQLNKQRVKTRIKEILIVLFAPS